MGYVHGKVCLLYYLQNSPILQYEPSPQALSQNTITPEYTRPILHIDFHVQKYVLNELPHLSYILRYLEDITYHHPCGINDFTPLYKIRVNMSILLYDYMWDNSFNHKIG